MGRTELLVLALLFVVPFFLVAIIDVLKSNFKASDKVAWVLVVYLPFLGPLLYFFIGRRQKISSPPADNKQK